MGFSFPDCGLRREQKDSEKEKKIGDDSCTHCIQIPYTHMNAKKKRLND